MHLSAETWAHAPPRPRGDVLIAHLADAMWQGAAPGQSRGTGHYSSRPSQLPPQGPPTAAAQHSPLAAQPDTASESPPLSERDFSRAAAMSPACPHPLGRKCRLPADGLFCPACISGVVVCAFHMAEDPCRGKTVDSGLRSDASEWVPRRHLLATAPGVTGSGSQPQTASHEHANHRQQQSRHPPSTALPQPPPPPMKTLSQPRPPPPPPPLPPHKCVAGTTDEWATPDGKQSASQWLERAWVDKDDEESSTDVGCSEPGDTESGSSDALHPSPHGGMPYPLQPHQQGNVVWAGGNGWGVASRSTEAKSSICRYKL